MLVAVMVTLLAVMKPAAGGTTPVSKPVAVKTPLAHVAVGPLLAKLAPTSRHVSERITVMAPLVLVAVMVTLLAVMTPAAGGTTRVASPWL